MKTTRRVAGPVGVGVVLVAVSAVLVMTRTGPPRCGEDPARIAAAQERGAGAGGLTLADLPEDEARSLGAAMRESRYTIWRSDGNLPQGEVEPGEVLRASHPKQRYRASFADEGARRVPPGRDHRMVRELGRGPRARLDGAASARRG